MSDGSPLGRFPVRGFTAAARGAQLLPQARLAGPIPWVIAIMVALMTVAASGGLALNNVAHATRAELAGGLTVQIVEAAPAERERQADAALAVLRQSSRVASAKLVPEQELAALISPWLGTNGDGNDAVPVPALIDVRLKGGADPEAVADLRAIMADTAPAARIDAQTGWLGPVFSAIASLQWLALTLILLLALATGAAVWLAARTALGTNRETIEVVHHLGGTDAQIARIFQRSVATDAAMGGIAGLALGVAAVSLIGGRFAALESGMAASGSLGWLDWIVLLSIPILAIVLATLTARYTVISSLRRML